MVRRPLKPAGEWIYQLQQDYLNRGKSQETWNGDYWKILKRLPQREILTAAHLKAVVDSTEPNTKTRKRACMAIGALARFAQIPYDPSPYSGNYGPDSVAPRTIPTELQIESYWRSLSNSGWQWVYGVCAAFGLRPHEAFFIDLDQLKQRRPDLRVIKGKTGARTSYPFPAQWFDEFRLYRPRLPNVVIEGRSHEAIGHSATAYFGEIGIPHNLYDLRHAYALRMINLGVRDSYAARYMGHSEEVHRRTYRRWIEERDAASEWERVTGMMVKPDTQECRGKKRKS
jgi:integrase